MTDNYIYSIAADFHNATQVNIKDLQNEIDSDSGVGVIVSYINLYGDTVDIYFPNALTGPQKTSLDALVNVYTYTVSVKPSVTASHQVVVSNDPNNLGDYTSIAAAFNAGESAVFVRNGTYIETSDIVIPNGGQLTGELPGQTIIVLAGPYSISIDGSGGVQESVGTISITNNTSIVTGVGTMFTNLSVGNFILLGTNYYDILTIDSDTQVTLKDTYIGINVVNSNYTAQPMYTGCVISSLIIAGSYTNGIYVRAMRHGNIDAVAVTNCTQSVVLDNCSDLSIHQLICTFSGGIGLEMINCTSMSLNTVNVFNSLSHGMEVSGLNLVFASCACENNNSCGIHILSNATFVNMNNCVIKNNNNLGIMAELNALYISITDTEISTNNGYGINLLGHHNNVSSCFIIGNKGIGASVGLENVLIGNSILDNLGDGIRMPSGSDYCIVTDNSMEDNTGIGINALAIKSGISNNIIQGSGGDGIYVNGVKHRVSGNNIMGSGGIGIHMDTGANSCVITGNIVETSAGNGLEIVTGVTNCIVTSNNLEDNTGTNYVDNGTGTVSNSNIV